MNAANEIRDTRNMEGRWHFPLKCSDTRKCLKSQMFIYTHVVRECWYWPTTSHRQTQPNKWAIASFCSPSLASGEREASALWLSSSALWFCHHWTPSLPAVHTQEVMITLSFHKSSESVGQYNKCGVLVVFFPHKSGWIFYTWECKVRHTWLIVLVESNSCQSSLYFLSPPRVSCTVSERATTPRVTAERRHGSVPDKMTTHCRGVISASGDGVWE